ncbi:protein FAR1-RELATED SEQUENCE 5-like isoform X1 [Rhododendron vialii]|uniref:protein FAR1-RELATED SEQUENCE 5-like isoform X1 n=2 Tax=Rhododendron vialii TaxID=182163 RepID=UPI00265DBF46|nr:protein FAR1-RELATED SEQUENCE 5-like isoform X1 [Rhododendron vialii]
MSLFFMFSFCYVSVSFNSFSPTLSELQFETNWIRSISQERKERDIMDQFDGGQGGHANVHNDKFNSSSYSKNDILEQKFDSEDDAHAFYNAYAKEMRFSIRKDRLKVDETNVPRKRKWVCSKQGRRAKKHLDRKDRKRPPRDETRVGCRATFSIRYDKGVEKYVVTHFDNEHNHPFIEKRCVPFLLPHRCVSDAVKAQTKAMHNVGVKTGQIMDMKVNESGGYGDVGFTLKDLQNKIEVERRVELKDGDAEGALGYLSARANADPLFFFKYTVDEDNRLGKLFWADSKSRMDYAAFGDVLIFDTTYRTNAYKKPFVILAGVSNHFLTTIFGCALLVDETFATYTWCWKP